MSSAEIKIRPARDGEEMAAALALRRAVFVGEQGLFSSSDQDENDQKAIHLVALDREKVVGTVRIFPEQERTWVGSRLAVEEHYRNGVGASLVRGAEAEVCRRGGSRLQALIQAQNITFFERLGWRRISSSFRYRGKLHYRMEKDFSLPGKTGSGGKGG
jgi:putative N-acetyltransferase (TIGR04045 family)